MNEIAVKLRVGQAVMLLHAIGDMLVDMPMRRDEYEVLEEIQRRVREALDDEC